MEANGDFSCAFALIHFSFLCASSANKLEVNGAKLVIWSVVEPSLTIIAACIPVVRTFFRDLFRSSIFRSKAGIQGRMVQLSDILETVEPGSREPGSTEAAA